MFRQDSLTGTTDSLVLITPVRNRHIIFTHISGINHTLCLTCNHGFASLRYLQEAVMRDFLKRFWRNECGSSALEYCMLMTFVMVTATTVADAATTEIVNLFQKIANTLNSVTQAMEYSTT
jgi:Flp pilus assembly pilin Flp